MAINQLLMLEQINMEYHGFRQNQVLTHTQLNELIDFFEDQDRLTRTCLIGVGVVCGLHIHYDNSIPEISIGKGCAVTTDGDLLKLNKTEYLHYKPYKNKKEVTGDPIYDPFFPPPPPNKQIKLWELVLPGKNGKLPNGSKQLSLFKSNTGNELGNMVVLLYLEYYKRDPDMCTAIDCDNQGYKQVAKIRALLASPDNADKIIERSPTSEIIADSIYKSFYDAGIDYYKLPVIHPRRIILNPINTKGMAVLAKSYEKAIANDKNILIANIKKCYDYFSFIVDPDSKIDINAIVTKLTSQFKKKFKPNQVQYLYDYYKDICNCYNEIREEIYNCIFICCPDKHAFPKHVMLGSLLNPNNSKIWPYRHTFYPSPVITKNKAGLKKVKNYWRRMNEMVYHFWIKENQVPVDITPSKDYNEALENRAIPFYYRNIDHLAQYWNYKYRQRGTEHIINAYQDDSYKKNYNPSKNPLYYDIDKNNFFRIEGHMGLTLDNALQKITKIRADKSLPFDIVAVRLGKGSRYDIDIKDFECYFEDLNAILKAWYVEQNCIYQKIIKYFSGFMLDRESNFHVADKLYLATNSGNLAYNVAARIDPKIDALNVASDEKESATLSRVDFCNKSSLNAHINDLLETSEATLGSYLKEVITQSGFKENMVDEAINYISSKDKNVAKLNADEITVIFKTPITILTYAIAIYVKRPYEIKDITEKDIKNLISKMMRFCSYIEGISKKMDSYFTSKNYVKIGFEFNYLALLMQLRQNCCSIKKLIYILQEIYKRKRKILDSLSLEKYAKDHPGMEHKAGVHRGGTFVLVYTSKKGEKPKPEKADESLSWESPSLAYLRDEKYLGAYKEVDSLDWNNATDDIKFADETVFAKYMFDNKDMVNYSEELDKFFQYKQIDKISAERTYFEAKIASILKEWCENKDILDTYKPSEKSVVADFCLPYMLASHCPPVNFIMPQPRYILSLPKSETCSKDTRLEFTKYPADGKVETSAELTKTIIEDGGKTYFDPSKVPANKFGTEISFTINKQVTDCQITVFKTPKSNFKYKEDDQPGNILYITFTNLSDDNNNKYSYIWDFGDGNQKETTSKEPFIYKYNKARLIELGYSVVTVKLTAIHGACKDEFSLQIKLPDDQKLSLSLPKRLVCSNHKPMPFTVVPGNGIVSSEEEPESVAKMDGKYHFIPANVTQFDKLIHFKVNDKPVDCKIAVLKYPQAKFDMKYFKEGNYLTLQLINRSNPENLSGISYDWNFGDIVSRNDVQHELPFQERLDLNKLKEAGIKELVITLTAKNSVCKNSLSKKINIEKMIKDLPDTDCGANLENLLVAEIQILASEELKKLLRASRNQNAGKLYNNTASIINWSIRNAENYNKAVFQTTILNKVDELISTYFMNNTDYNIDDKILTPILQALMRLTAIAIRCADKISSTAKDKLISIYDKLIELVPELASQLKRLDKNKTISGYLEEFITSIPVQEKEITDKTKKLIELITQYYNQ